jgi:hypothetical protein
MITGHAGDTVHQGIKVSNNKQTNKHRSTHHDVEAGKSGWPLRL